MTHPPLHVLLGHPVAHSWSPLLHRHVMKRLGRPGVYVAADVAPSRLVDAVRGLWALGARGVNLTMPHKERVLELVTDVTPEAQMLGAANTLVRGETGWIAHNTDLFGYQVMLAEAMPRKALILGAGGGARAVAHALALLGCRLVVAVREPAAGERLLEDLGVEGLVRPWHEREIGLADVDLVVNCTPVGLGTAGTPPADRGRRTEPDGPTPLGPEALGRLPAGSLVHDLVYARGETPLVHWARLCGHEALDGRSMLAGQAAAAQWAWWGGELPLATCREVLEDLLV
ncbi:MAG: shikimate dehydrogenase [Candidatus Sericytochromatia bacterium]|nr:shikimate dehydrogenase [Candidatus Sericytochromatia bacterium]